MESLFLLKSFEPITTLVPSILKENNVEIQDLPLKIDRIPHKINHDFYNLGVTESFNRKSLNIDFRNTYLIEGRAVLNKEPRKAFVTLLTFNYEYVTSVLTDSEGFYKIDNLCYQDYIIIVEDFYSEYNHSIQVGVKPVEQS